MISSSLPKREVITAGGSVLDVVVVTAEAQYITVSQLKPSISFDLP